MGLTWFKCWRWQPTMQFTFSFLGWSINGYLAKAGIYIQMACTRLPWLGHSVAHAISANIKTYDDLHFFQGYCHLPSLDSSILFFYCVTYHSVTYSLNFYHYFYSIHVTLQTITSLSLILKTINCIYFQLLMYTIYGSLPWVICLHFPLTNIDMSANELLISDCIFLSNSSFAHSLSSFSRL